jgi:molybdate transport system ATP-binding protein
MSLEVDVAAGLGEFRLTVKLGADAGEVVAILGPNGAGKTTLLKVVLGLIDPSRGTVILDGHPLVDTARGIQTPTDRRGVGMVFQDYLLFPHLSALDNVAFGPMAAGLGRRGAMELAGRWLRRVGLEGREDLLPQQLSGGQAQRVALARALITEPRLLLLDEPLAALDVGSRHEIRRDLAGHLSELEIPCLFVTHEPLEAAVLADRIVILEDGEVTQQGTLAEITRRPRTSWAARLAGANLYRGAGSGHEVQLSGTTLTVAEIQTGGVFVLIHPSAVALHHREPTGSPRNVWKATVASLEQVGERIRVALDGPLPIVAEITAAALATLQLGRQDQVWVSVKATEIETYPA